MPVRADCYARPMERTLRGLWLEVRVIPVLLWSFSALTVGTALGADRADALNRWYYVGAITLGVLIQGLLAHTVNEIEDWRSGTDRDPSPRMLSGGSKVIKNGLLTARTLRVVFCGALALTVVLGLVMVASRGVIMLPFGLVGVGGAILYTLPPVRAAYRPFAGESIAFVCMGACVVGAALLQSTGVSRVTWLTAVAVAAYTVSMLMVHHYLDHDADRVARPPKVTTIVWMGLDRGRQYAIGWCVTGLLAAMAAAAVQPRLVPLVAGYGLGLLAHLRCNPRDVESVTKNEMAIIFCGIAAALGSAALLVPALTWALAAAAVLIILELRLAVAPAESPAA
jgi:1,4-dihydroxy-2-naphthoate octaprenyltransferase